MINSMNDYGPVQSAYEDEQKKLDFQNEIELSLRLERLLEDFGYDLQPQIVDGRAEIALIKL